MNKGSFLAVVSLMPACAVGPSAGDADLREYRRADDRIEAAENFNRLQRNCAAMGGAVVLPRDSGGRMPPTAAELRLATCSARPGARLSF
ncbi:MAG TPA: hypothetical protein VHG33_00630 [Woeseiaceae bacterium]|nr:hypothetical protein [Woeseiaceae bacterium]